MKGFPQKRGRGEEDANLAVSFILSLLNFGCRSWKLETSLYNRGVGIS